MVNIFIDPVFAPTYADSPLVLVDAGAGGGLKGTWKRARRFLRVIGFEPDPRTRPEARANDLYLDTGLYRERGVLDFYLTRDPSVSSVYKPNRVFIDRFPEADRFDLMQVAQIAVDSLDSQIRYHGVPYVDFIKIDTQGSELAILEGAKDVLRGSFGLEVEVEFCELYEGQPLFHQVDAFLHDSGFELFDLRPTYWKRTIGLDYGGPKGQIVWGHALYLKDSGTVSRMGYANLELSEAKARLLRAFTVCLLYGYADYGLELLAEAGREAFSEREHGIIDGAIRRGMRVRRAIPDFPGRTALARLAHRMHRLLDQDRGGRLRTSPRLGSFD